MLVGRQTIKLRWIIVGAITVLLILVLGSHIWSHRHQSTLPNATSLIAIVVGAIFGTFTGRFVVSLFSARFGRRDPIIGASVLVLLIIAYSLPLYSSAISELISGIGLSNVKTPFLELTMRERGGKSVTAASGTASNPGEVPRASDPLPGLNWLSLDTIFNADPAKDSPPPSDEEYTKALEKTLDSTLLSDEDYIRFFEKDIFTSKDHINDVDQVIRFLTPTKALSKCLEKYISVIPNSELLLVDVKPVIKSMFMLRARAKIDLSATKPKPDWEYSSEQEGLFLTVTGRVLKQVNDKFSQLPQWQPCDLQETPAAGKIDHRQPYTALVLADLIHAHGSPDEAIGVLAEWLDVSDAYRKKARKELEKIPKWWELRVMSRISILMAEVAGQSNLAYREFFDAYKKELENYFGQENITLAMLEDKCKSWPNVDIHKFAREISGARSNSTDRSDLLNSFAEQKAFYLLLAAEDEALRTEVNFVGEEAKIERLERLYDRATFLASVGRECLPRYFNERQGNGIIADQQVTVGLLDLTIADRMASVAVSRGDRDRAGEIAKAGANALREGYATLSSFIAEDRKNLQKDPSWNHRVFPRSDWEKSANLAERAFLRLRSKGD